MRKPTVFISHAREDEQFAHRLADDLQRLGVQVWIAPESIPPGEKWVRAIERGMAESSHVVIVLTPAAQESEWVEIETDAAIALEREGRIQVVPLDVEPCEVPLFLRMYQMVSFHRDYGAGLSQLADILGVRITPPEPVLPTVMERGQPFEPEMILPPAKGVKIPIPNELVENVKAGKCILFLGPMASAPSPEGSRFEYKQAPPSYAELSRRLAATCRYPDADVTNLQRVSFFFQTRPGGSRFSLARAISQEITGPDIVPSPLLHMLAALPFPIVITTNYDRLFDLALSTANTIDGRPKQPIVRIYDPTWTSAPEAVPLDPPEEQPILFKLYGDIDKPESIVVTEEDYDVFRQRMSSPHQHPIHDYIRARMQRWPILFIGYSLKDANLSSLLRMLRWSVDRAMSPLAFLVDPSPADLDWQHGAKLTVRPIRENPWDFVPSLYEEIMEVEYVP